MSEAVRRWVEAYGRAWEEMDADAAAALFSEDATYRSLIFDEPNRRQDGIRDYWTRATSDQSDVAVTMGEPLIDGDRVAVEWWTTMLDSSGDEDLTLPGVLLLWFDPDGRCRSLREYWAFEPGRHEPFKGWGEKAPGDTEATRDWVSRWAAAYRTLWTAADPDGVADLCAEEVAYRTQVFRDPEKGRDAVREYTDMAFESEDDRTVAFGRPFADDGTAAVEWWCTFTDLDENPPAPATIAGCSIQTYDNDGLVLTSRDYWHLQADVHNPPEEWGT